MAAKRAKTRSDGDETLSLTSLEVENVLRIKAVKLVLEPGGAVLIEARNEQGKSSVLKSLEILLAGMSETPDEPLHGDAKSGEIVARFNMLADEDDPDSEVVESILVSKVFRKGRSPALSIHREGERQTAPQTLLNDLLDHVSLDPLKFMAMDDHERLRALSDLMGFDSAPFDLRHDQLFGQRRDANRDAKRLEIELSAVPTHKDAPAMPVSVEELSRELAVRRRANADVDERQRAAAELSTKVKSFEDEVRDAEEDAEAIKEKIAELEAAIELERETLVRAVAVAAKHRVELAKKQVDAKAAVKAASALTRADEDAVVRQIGGAEELNRKYRENLRHHELSAQLVETCAEAARLDEALKVVESEREQARLAARERLPVPELDITADAVLYRGLPLSQAGSSAQLRVSVAVAIALNKRKRVKLLLVDDGEKLDADGERIVLEMARKAGFQVIMTRVIKRNEDADKASVLIEDGEVKA